MKRRILRVLLLGAAGLLIWAFLIFSVDAHDSWISRGGHRNAAEYVAEPVGWAKPAGARSA